MHYRIATFRHRPPHPFHRHPLLRPKEIHQNIHLQKNQRNLPLIHLFLPRLPRLPRLFRRHLRHLRMEHQLLVFVV